MHDPQSLGMHGAYLLAKISITRGENYQRSLSDAVAGVILPASVYDRLKATITHAVMLAINQEPSIRVLVSIYLKEGSSRGGTPSTTAWGFFHTERSVPPGIHEIEVYLYPEP